MSKLEVFFFYLHNDGSQLREGLVPKKNIDVSQPLMFSNPAAITKSIWIVATRLSGTIVK